MLTSELIDATPIPPYKQKKLYDGSGHGLYLLVMPNGRKGWRAMYQPAGAKRSTKSFGSYPEVPPEVARERCKAFQEAIARGENPVAVEREQKDAAAEAAANTFGKAGTAYLAHDDTLSEKTKIGHRRYLGHLKKLWGRPLDSIERADLVEVCRVVEARGNRETAHRVASFADNVYLYAIDSGMTKRAANPAERLVKALKPVIVTSRAGITDPAKFAELMRYIDGDDYSFLPVRHALRMLARVACRPGELEAAEWSEIDLQRAEWNVPAGRMKMKKPHWVPLSTQVIAILKAQREISGDGRYVFPNNRSEKRPMSNGALRGALANLGYKKGGWATIDAQDPHGFRVSFSSLMNAAGEDPRIIEFCASRKFQGEVAAIYNRAQYQPERRALMQAWSDYIDRLKAA
jgi:integrase